MTHRTSSLAGLPAETPLVSPTSMLGSLLGSRPGAGALLSLLLLVLGSLWTSAQAQGEPTELRDLPSFSDEIDTSIRWLRSQQERATGAYGAGVEATALVLVALAESPRAYGRADGPFVAGALDFLVAQQREDGSIADEDAKPEQVAKQTQRAAQALTLYFDETLEEPLAAALAKLPPSGPGSLESADSDFELGPDDPSQLAALGVELLAARRADGSWRTANDDDEAAVSTTAVAVVQLSRIETQLAKLRPKAPGGAASALPTFEPADREKVQQAQLTGARFLTKSAVSEGRWGMPDRPDPGITAMVVGALQTLPEPRPADVQAHIDAGLAWLVELQREDGSIHAGQLANYVTSAAVLALAGTTGEQRAELQPVIERARKFLQGLQADEGEGYTEGDRYYGGIGYGGDERPDLSNLQMALEALAASGLESDDPTFSKALSFLERCQNRSESNDVRISEGSAVIASGDDGGAGYMPGDSKAGFVELDDGTLVPRSYGSMTYALLKCYVFAGLPADDPRLRAAWEWCQQNYTLDVNPGFGASSDPRAAYQGLFYYFLTMARALDAYGEQTLVDGAGNEHAWRNELCGRLVVMQSKIDGSWTNHNASRWLEGNPLLATAYALQALGAALPES